MIEKQASAPGERDLYTLVEEFFRSTFATDNALITEAVRRMLAAGGKRLRPRLTLLAAQAGGADPREHLPLAAYMELIHVGTLIHDDVVDRADTRRGVNATAVDYGNRVSVLAGDYLFAWIFKNVTAHYIEIVVKKTATLFAASAECGAIMAGAPPLRVKALRDFGLYYGIAFQMLDDLLDMTASAAELGKPVGNDLTERKMTIPVILALESRDVDLRAGLARYYGDRPEGDDDGRIALVAAIARTGGLIKTREAIESYVERAKMSLAPLGNHAARAELNALADALGRDSNARTR